MKNLVIGGAGFLGSNLCDALLDRGDKVICIDNFITGSRSNIEHLRDNKNFRFIEADIITLDIEKINFPFVPDIIFHLASPASPKDYICYPLETLRVNSIGTERCLNLALKTGAKFLFTSTSEVYGDPIETPQKETYWGNVNPVGPRSVYDEAKRYAEALIMAYQRIYKIKVYIPRIFNTYGPRMRLDDGRVIPNFIAQAIKKNPLTIYGDGKQTRSFCYVDDLIKGLLLLVETDYHMPVNLGNPDEFTIIELANKINEITGLNLPLEFLPPVVDDPRKRRPDISLAKKLLGWAPAVNLEDGLRRTLYYYMKGEK
ncbi:MAG: SDR family oxidoreductase [Candidatus Omnitrophica bacterium]|nr:SDR family oxidoreductase [Candidatus Omnitrophota bacterium]MCM8824882.1 SDR family oxidoreductase [Candidatus Omnitrophota bacterium]